MPAYRLRLSMPSRTSAADARGTFLWGNDGRSSFVTSLGPSLGDLGPVPKPNIELVRLAVGVLAVDRSTLRRVRGSNWSRRDLELTVPVTDASRWEQIRHRLEKLLGFLSGDDWQLDFVAARSPKERTRVVNRPVSRVVLLSGGADSAIGALVTRNQLSTDPYTLVSHVGATNLSPIQEEIATQLATLLPDGNQLHQRIRLGRGRKRVDGRNFPSEVTTRSRSLLFLSLGLAVASIDGVELWIPENGFASLNPPLGADQRGSISTRTTHPTFLSGLSEILTEIGVHAPICNPFERMTKGEMFRHTAGLIGEDRAATFLTSTHSCAHTGHRSFHLPVTMQCGVCFGCLLRRSAFAASGLADGTVYVSSLGRADVARYLADKSMERAVQEFVERGIAEADVASMSLPPAYPSRDAFDLIRRTMGELRLLG